MFRFEDLNLPLVELLKPKKLTDLAHGKLHDSNIHNGVSRSEGASVELAAGNSQRLLRAGRSERHGGRLRTGTSRAELGSGIRFTILRKNASRTTLGANTGFALGSWLVS